MIFLRLPALWSLALTSFLLSAPALASGPLPPTTNASTLNNVSNYYPLAVGNRWLYQGVNGFYVSGMQTINGVQTAVLSDVNPALTIPEEIWPETNLYITNDDAGYRLHRWGAAGHVCFTTIDCYGYTATFNPPLNLLPPFPVIGQTYNFSGSVSADVAGLNMAYPLTYSVTTSLRELEPVTTPAGSFLALRVDYTIRISGAIEGTSTAVDFNSTEWLAEGKGIVAKTSVKNGSLSPLMSLASTNFGRREDCLFNWAERIYALANSTTESSDPYTFRSYFLQWPNKQYFGVSSADDHVYHLAQGRLTDLGLVTDWYNKAGCP